MPKKNEEPYQENYIVPDVSGSQCWDNFEEIDYNKNGVEDMTIH